GFGFRWGSGSHGTPGIRGRGDEGRHRSGCLHHQDDGTRADQRGFRSDAPRQGHPVGHQVLREMVMAGELVRISANKSFGGMHERYEHQSAATGTKMIVGVYRPPQALEGKAVPFVTWLSGLTCTDQNFMEKAGSHRVAAEL